MHSKFKDEDILKFLYDEMLPEQSEEFLDALAHNEELFEKYELFQDVEDRLSTVSYLPSGTSLEKIMSVVKEENPAVIQKRKSRLVPTSIGMGLVVAAFMVLFITKGIFGGDTLSPVIPAQEKNVYVQDMKLKDAELSWDDELGDRIESIEERTRNMSDEPLL